MNAFEKLQGSVFKKMLGAVTPSIAVAIALGGSVASMHGEIGRQADNMQTAVYERVNNVVLSQMQKEYEAAGGLEAERNAEIPEEADSGQPDFQMPLEAKIQKYVAEHDSHNNKSKRKI